MIVRLLIDSVFFVSPSSSLPSRIPVARQSRCMSLCKGSAIGQKRC